tara:strand:- start:903 stop:2579 length:1677 start_codon:yes stop_codon:yes gene_type:complete
MEEINPKDKEWFSQIKEPVVLKSMSSVNWDEEADIAIIGCGGAGVAAALEASEQKQDVLVLDRFFGGGATAISGGVFYAGGGTQIQKEAGVEDSPEEMYKYLQMEVKGIIKDSTLKKFCEDSSNNVDWLMKHGVLFNSSLYRKKTSYPTSEYYLYHSDNSLVPEYAARAKPAARGHRGFIKNSLRVTGLGGSIFYPLLNAAKNNGVRLMLQTEAIRLVQNRNGKVVGVEVLQIPPKTSAARKHMKFSKRASAYQMLIRPLANYYRKKALRIEEKERVSKFIKAKKGVIIAAGGFIFNREMVRRYIPKYENGFPLGTTGDDGAGIRLGQSVGGVAAHMNRATAWRFLNPPVAWGQGIVVNAQGERYCNEMVYGSILGEAMIENHNGKGILIIDSQLRKETLSQLGPGKLMPFQRNPVILNMLFKSKKAKTIAGLAKKCDMSPLKLYDSIEKYNLAGEGIAKDPFGKPTDDCRGIRKSPFYAIDVSLENSLFPCSVITLGGLKINEESGNVLNEEGKDIEGLYAAGRTAVGVCSNIYVSGLSIGDCIFSGRRAGLHASSL